MQNNLDSKIWNSGRVWANLGTQWREPRAWLWWLGKSKDITNSHTQNQLHLSTLWCWTRTIILPWFSSMAVESRFFSFFVYRVGLIDPDRSKRYSWCKWWSLWMFWGPVLYLYSSGWSRGAIFDEDLTSIYGGPVFSEKSTILVQPKQPRNNYRCLQS